MNISTEMIGRIAPLAVLFLTIGIFILDVLAPFGVAISVLYVLPLLLTFFSGRPHDSLGF